MEVLRHFLHEAGYEFVDGIDPTTALTAVRDDKRVKIVDGFALDIERILFMPKPDPDWWQVGNSAHVWLAGKNNPYPGPMDDEVEVRSYKSVMERRANRFLEAWDTAVNSLRYCDLLQRIKEPTS